MKCPNCEREVELEEELELKLDDEPEGRCVDIDYNCPDCEKTFFARIRQDDWIDTEM